MAITGATHPAHPNVPNQDLIIMAPDVAILLDGAGPGEDGGGCVHGSAWFARQLGARLAAGVLGNSAPLADILAWSIEEVASLHRKTCDLDHPGTPATAVAVARRSEDFIEYLYLHNSPMILTRHNGAPIVMCDRRVEAVPEIQQCWNDVQGLPLGSEEHQVAYQAYLTATLTHRNTDRGYWVAGADPSVAAQAVTGSRPAESLRSVSLFSDAVADYVERYSTTTWPQINLSLDWNGPASVISTVRAASRRCPRIAVQGDASIVHWRLGGR